MMCLHPSNCSQASTGHVAHSIGESSSEHEVPEPEGDEQVEDTSGRGDLNARQGCRTVCLFFFFLFEFDSRVRARILYSTLYAYYNTCLDILLPEYELVVYTAVCTWMKI